MTSYLYTDEDQFSAFLEKLFIGFSQLDKAFMTKRGLQITTEAYEGTMKWVFEVTKELRARNAGRLGFTLRSSISWLPEGGEGRFCLTVRFPTDSSIRRYLHRKGDRLSSEALSLYNAVGGLQDIIEFEKKGDPNAPVPPF